MWAICCLETARANAYKVCELCRLRAACFVIYSSYSSMILFSSEIFVVLLLWLCHLLVTLLTAIVLKRNGIFWHHCACVDNFKQNGVFWRQHLPAVRIWTWPKYNKHHHDLKNQLYRFIDMYIGKIFWPTAPCRGCPEKEIWGQG